MSQITLKSSVFLRQIAVGILRDRADAVQNKGMGIHGFTGLCVNKCKHQSVAGIKLAAIAVGGILGGGNIDIKANRIFGEMVDAERIAGGGCRLPRLRYNRQMILVEGAEIHGFRSK